MKIKILIVGLAVAVFGFDAQATSRKNALEFPIAEGTTVFDSQSGHSELPGRTIERLHEIARDQAGIWADTILEGDYFADGATQLDRVIAFVRGNQVVAYRITYSERAWDTSDCDFDVDELETLFACTPGRIVESSFVSHDLTSFTRDYDDLANFIE